MEFCDMTLADFFEKGRTSLESLWIKSVKGYETAEKDARIWLGVCSILMDITNGIDFIHTRGEIHRDLKPSNGNLAFT